MVPSNRKNFQCCITSTISTCVHLCLIFWSNSKLFEVFWLFVKNVICIFNCNVVRCAVCTVPMYCIMYYVSMMYWESNFNLKNLKKMKNSFLYTDMIQFHGFHVYKTSILLYRIILIVKLSFLHFHFNPFHFLCLEASCIQSVIVSVI